MQLSILLLTHNTYSLTHNLMNIRSFLLPLLVLGSAATMQAQSGINNPVTRAAISSYTEQLRENPQNYHALFGRGNEYYQHDDYVRALADFDEALKYAPASGDEEQTRMQALLLRADIYNQTKRHELALKDLDEAFSLAPDSYSIVYQRANTEFLLGKYAAADTDYKRLRAINPRSVESLIGQARVAVKQNNLGIANELLAKAVALDPNDGGVLVRRASVRKMMGDHNGAVDDLILAISLNDPRPNNALQELVDYGKTNYAATIAGLTNAISAAPSSGMFPYLRAMIAQAHYNYKAALADYRLILEKGLYNYHGIQASMAQCHYALGEYEAALENIDEALGMTRGQASYFALRSDILRALGRAEGALTAAEAGLLVDSSSVPALVSLGLARVALGKPAEASAALGEAVMNDSADPMPLLLRAWVVKDILNQPEVARGMLQQVCDMEFAPDDVRSYRGFALLELGETENAVSWMQNILDNVPDNDGFIHYVATCLFARADRSDEAIRAMEVALEKGYANYYDWADATDGWVNPGSLRDELRFLNLLNRYSIIFGK